LDTFSSGQTVRTLPCFHSYHKDCADKWLQTNPTCPACKFPAIESTSSGPPSTNPSYYASTGSLSPPYSSSSYMPGYSQPSTTSVSIPSGSGSGGSLATCRGCGQQFVRNPDIRPATSQFYRCPQCSGLTDRAIVNSCLIL